MHALWVTAAHTGLRPAEVLALRWDDIDFEPAVLHVRRALVRVSKEVFYGPCKAGSARTVPMSVGLIDALRAHRKRQLEERLRIGAGWVDERLVFYQPGRWGTGPASRSSEGFRSLARLS